MDMIVFAGQSNMQGQTERLSECEVVEGALEYRFLTDEAVPLKNPVGESIRADLSAGEDPTPESDIPKWVANHVLGAACYGHTNMVPEFCRTYVRETGREVLAVHVAKGSTMVGEWLPGTDGYRVLVHKVQAAQKKYPCERVLLAWLQGESDAIFETGKEPYKERIAQLCAALKKDIGLEKFGVIRVGRFIGNFHDDEIIEAQDEICAEHPDFLMLTQIATELNTQPEQMHPDIHGHYSAKGLETLGAAAAKTLAAYVMGK